MEQLTRELDGHCRTPSGFCAVVPKIASGRTQEGFNWFEYKTSPLSAITRVEWPSDAPFALFDNETAVSMLRAGYASDLSDLALDNYNRLVADHNEAEKAQAAKAAADAEAAKKAAETTPSKKKTAGGQQGASASDGTTNAGEGTNTQPATTVATPAPGENPAPPAVFPPAGWTVHPTAEGYFYKDQEVITEAELRAKVAAGDA